MGWLAWTGIGLAAFWVLWLFVVVPFVRRIEGGEKDG